MCQFCSNQKNNKQPKFRLFTINPIPFHTPPRSQENPAVSPDTAHTPSKVQKNSTVSPNTAHTPSKVQKNSTVSPNTAYTPSKIQKNSTVLLKFPKSSSSQPQSQKFKIKQNSSQSIFSKEISKYQIDTSRNITDVTNEIQKLLYDYQLIHLRIIVFLEQIHIKGFIMNIDKELITIIGPNVQVKNNSTNKIIKSPNKINIKIKSIQAISDTGNFLKKNNTDQID
ncbi:hypothetical protein [Bacillus mycoides]|uniref:hypothetical protein n=1 Tax=Bacillus mycoides TaxID=1405 RepID=UPI002DF7C044|nr:hypothetical protein [Bacillus mycoides]MEC5267230.1 hypothetical protein [Bacillus mycoides]